jgi:hypothetical protein
VVPKESARLPNQGGVREESETGVGSRAHIRRPEGTLGSPSRKSAGQRPLTSRQGDKGFAPRLLHFIVGVSGAILDLQMGTRHQIV